MPLAPVTHETAFDAAFASLLARSRPRLLHFLQRLCAQDAEDLLQETLAKVWRLRASFHENGNGEAWLLQAAFRTFCDHRARSKTRAAVAAQADVEQLTAPMRACSLELRDEVAARLQALLPIERELLLAFHGHSVSLKDLAARHGLPLNTVKSHLHRARARLWAEGGRDDRR
ncbi:MAG: RNA polymerase sigma factor [Planctomycetota bacterium]